MPTASAVSETTVRRARWPVCGATMGIIRIAVARPGHAVLVSMRRTIRSGAARQPTMSRLPSERGQHRSTVVPRPGAEVISA